MEENKELNEQEPNLSQRVVTVRKCFRTIKELGKIGSTKEHAVVHFSLQMVWNSLTNNLTK